MRTLIVVSLLLLACASTPPRVQKQEIPKTPVDTYFAQAPEKAFTELSMIAATYKEYGVFKPKGDEARMIEMLKDKAREINADAIMNINIETEFIPGQQNKLWKASAIAIKYKT